MRLFGVHTSIRGGLINAVKEAGLLGCTTFQIFLHSPRVWAIPEKTFKEVELFRKEAKISGFSEYYVHSSYLINLVSDRKEVVEKSIKLLKEEVILSDKLGAKYYVLHLRDNPRFSKKKILNLLSSSLKALPKELNLKILIENTASGRIGSNIEELALFVKDLMHEVPKVSGIAVDSCHLYASGLNLQDLYLKMINKPGSDFFRLAKLLHLNDSKFEVGSEKDRHENLGEGKIGLDGLKAFLDYFIGLPVILETPKKSIFDDRKNLSVLKMLLEKSFS